MDVKIFSVEQGFCSLITTDDRNTILVDCSRNSKTGFRPSSHLLRRGFKIVGLLVVSKYDESHLDDLETLRERLAIRSLRRNTSIDPDQLKRFVLDSGSAQPGMSALLEIARAHPCETQPTRLPEFPGIELFTFQNPYPEFSDANNLSLVTFLSYRHIHMVLPGDIEEPGWKALLKNPCFRQCLRKVNIFIASNHGEMSGYCEDVFKFCYPEVIIIPDGCSGDDTPRVDYTKHALGIRWQDESTRHVLSTHQYGVIRILEKPGFPYIIHVYENPL